MVQILRSAQGSDSVIAIDTVVRRALDLGQVGCLVQSCRSLILGVAGAGQGSQRGEIQVAVNHVALAGKGVCQDTT